MKVTVVVSGQLIEYDPKETPIMLTLSDEDKKNIANMHKSCTKYLVFNGDFSDGQIDKIREKFLGI